MTHFGGRAGARRVTADTSRVSEHSQSEAVAAIVWALLIAGCSLPTSGLFSAAVADAGGGARDGGIELDATVEVLDAGSVSQADAESPPPEPSSDAAAPADAEPRKDDAAPADSGAAGDGGVPCGEPGAVSWGGHCYFPIDTDAGFEEQQATCVSSGAHLATVTSAGENAVVVNLVQSADRWIGLREPDGGPPQASAFEWVTGEPASYTGGWRLGEPNGSGPCARATSTGWADWVCEDGYGAVCERE